MQCYFARRPARVRALSHRAAWFGYHLLANNACTRLLGVAAFSDSFRGLELVPVKWRYLVPPTSG